jgi:methionyl-tRNA formyltransferase
LNNLPGSLELAFAGTPQFAVPALDALWASRHRVRAVFTQADRPAGRGRALSSGAVKRRAAELGIEVHQPLSFKSPEARETLRALAVDAFVVVAYGLILPAEVLDIPRLGCLNIHASLLPRWRGAAPIQRAILAGDAQTGVTIMRMEAGLDTGPTYTARTVDIGPQETAGMLHDRLAVLGAELICTTLDQLAAGPVDAVPQPAAGVCYAAKIEKREAQIDWGRDANLIARQVRAFNPWPIAETRLRGAQLRIWEAHPVAPMPGGAGSDGAAPGTVVGVSPAGIDVACGDGMLRVTRLQAPGRNPLNALQFANAQPLAGLLLGQP